jgi:hypothetical protein
MLEDGKYHKESMFDRVTGQTAFHVVKLNVGYTSG